MLLIINELMNESSQFFNKFDETIDKAGPGET